MDEQSIPDPELGDDPVLADGIADVATPDEVADVPLHDLMDADDLSNTDEIVDPADLPNTGEVLDPADLSYPGAAEDNPENWREDPLIDEEPLNEPGMLSDQTLREETAEERFEDGDAQVPPEVPTIGEAALDVDFDDPASADEEDASDDPAHLGGDPLAAFDPEDREL
ncbi:hypothetical protein J2M53_15325 [Arthrobacter sp. zg-ZUI100]|uniref:Uncharacterized protein n=1 Tax=Arthrobacter jiangjiafuii TaxID=2817475 RepID=A0A975R0N7_9MICC|nr:hypothetical protein [Arthrobacter jiangjiafuii]MBP3037616.1 hypothetical protein [Arthrobacter jiangjiafuii]MBP3044758.1 hypothetical protein [Arthrobacter jiangjiafuii]QWC10412.1 hypothetical protein KKR91_01790 [Arthrobacter jiangjiafuii]